MGCQRFKRQKGHQSQMAADEITNGSRRRLAGLGLDPVCDHLCLSVVLLAFSGLSVAQPCLVKPIRQPVTFLPAAASSLWRIRVVRYALLKRVSRANSIAAKGIASPIAIPAISKSPNWL